MNRGSILYNENIKLPTRESLLNSAELDRDRQRIRNGLPICYVANQVKTHQSYSTSCTQLLTIGVLPSGLKVSVLLTNLDIYIDVFPTALTNASADSDMQIALDQIQDMKPYEAESYMRDKFPEMMNEYANKVNMLAQSSSSNEQNIIFTRIFNLGVRGKIIGRRLFYKNVDLHKNSANIAYGFKELFVASYSTGNIIDVVAARRNIYFGAWMKLKKYKSCFPSSREAITKAEFNIELDINDYERIEERDYALLGVTKDMMNIYKTLMLTIDIESADLSQTEDIKSENNNKGILSANNAVFNIGCIISFEHENKNICHKINIINTAAHPKVTEKYYNRLAVPGSLTIVTRNLRETLLAFTKVVVALKPDFIAGYNSLDFDIPQLLIAYRVNNLFDQFYSETTFIKYENLGAYKNKIVHNGCEYHFNDRNRTFWSNMRTTSFVSGINSVSSNGKLLMVNNSKLPSIKIKDNKKDYHEINIPGIIMLDVMLISWKQYPNDNSKGGMNYYLKKNGYPLKLDVPYYKIWLFYKMSRDYDIIAEPYSKADVCKHGKSCVHEFTTEKGETFTCEDYMKYYIGDKNISFDVFNALEGKSLIDNLQKVAEYCSYDAEAAMLLVKTYSFMTEKRKYCELVNLTLDKVIFRADGNKVENGVRGVLVEKGFSYIEETIRADGTFGTKITKLIKANPYLRNFQIKYKAPKNTGGHVEIHRKGKITIEFEIPDNIRIVNSKYVRDGKIKIAVPVDAVDFKSLYPSIIMAFNLCNTTITFDFNVVKKVLDNEPNSKFLTIKANDLLAESEFPEEMHKYYTDYYKIDSFRDSEFYVILHCGKREKYGIYAEYMGKFFDARGVAKKKMFNAEEKYESILEEAMESDEYAKLYNESGSDFKNKKAFLEDLLFKENEEYRNAKIEFSNYNCSQLAVKVTMNATYGTLDYVANPIYSPLIATIITFYGRKYIKLSNQVCVEEGKTVNYNDTDSTYFNHEKEAFQDIVMRFVQGEFDMKALKRKLVRRSIRLSTSLRDLKNHYNRKIEDLGKLLQTCNPELDNIKIMNKLEKTKSRIENLPPMMFVDKLNKRFADDSGGLFLEQVREETLYPAVFCMLKKYFGLIHTKDYTSTFTMSNILFRGLKIRTANCTIFEREFSTKVVNRIIDEDDIDIKNIIFEELDAKLTEQVDYENLVKYENTARYKAGKKNKIKGMIDRMAVLREITDDPKLKSLYRIPFQLENVYFICTKNTTPYCINGRKINPCKHELFEYTDVVKYLYDKHLAKGTPFKEVDHIQYVISIAATCAQLMSYTEEELFNYREDIKHKDYVANIKNYIKKYCLDYYSSTDIAVKITNDMSLYKSYIRANKDIFNRIINLYIDCDETESFIISDARKMVSRMINLKQKLKFSDKLLNIAEYSYLEFGHVYDDFHRNDMYTFVTGNKIDERYIAFIRDQQIEIAKAMNSLFEYLNLMRDYIVNYLFGILNTRPETLPHIAKLQPEDIHKLAFCEFVFKQYCGLTVMLTGVTKHYYMNKKIYISQM